MTLKNGWMKVNERGHLKVKLMELEEQLIINLH